VAVVPGGGGDLPISEPSGRIGNRSIGKVGGKMVVKSPEALRSYLEDERTRLETLIAQIDSEGGENLGYGNHMADDASEAFEQAKELALHQNARQLLIQVTNALERFEQGTYGVCERCGEDIDPARLEALPYATLCLNCQKRVEA
jgi:DnaK suppressor protein